MYDLLALAYQADITRVFTFMVAREVSNRTYPQIGVPDGHHAMSHHQNRAGEDREARQDPDVPHRPVRRLPRASCDSMPDGDGTLLDHSLILYGSNMSNSNAAQPLPAAEPRRRRRPRHASRAAGT